MDLNFIRKSQAFSSRELTNLQFMTNNIFENQQKENNSSQDESVKKNLKLTKRRSKTDSEGRIHICTICQKSYLSYPALYTHNKMKHHMNNTARGRGRPKKDKNDDKVEKTKYNPINLTFFSKEERTGKINLKKEMKKAIDVAFYQIYSEDYKKRNELRNMKSYSNIVEHPFLNKFKNDEHDIYKNVINEHQVIDNILIEYLNKMSMYCNYDYYIKLIIFITLFREHINLTMGNENQNEKEYTEINEAENIIDSCNEFINLFLKVNDNQNDFGFTRDEAIDLTLNLSYWMYDHNYVYSRILLIKQ